MTRKTPRSMLAAIAAFVLSIAAVQTVNAQQPERQPQPVAQQASVDGTVGPRLTDAQPRVTAASAFRTGTSNAYKADTVTITASTLGLVALALVILLLL